MRRSYQRFLTLLKDEGRDMSDLSTLVESSVSFFKEVQYVLQTGSPEEKKEALEMLTFVREKVEESVERIAEQKGISKEALSELFDQKENFSSEEWDLMQKAKKEIVGSVEPSEKETKKPKKKNLSKKRGGWIRS